MLVLSLGASNRPPSTTVYTVGTYTLWNNLVRKYSITVKASNSYIVTEIAIKSESTELASVLQEPSGKCWLEECCADFQRVTSCDCVGTNSSFLMETFSSILFHVGSVE